MEEQGFRLEPTPYLAGYLRVLEAPRSIAQTLEHWLGLFHIQQAVMGLPALALDPQPGERVLDLCAAPGGKTVHLSDLMSETGPLVAVDPKEKRLRGLLSNVFRLGNSNVLVIASDGRELPGGAQFDRALVDAPCSAEGNYRRQQGRLPARKASFTEYVTDLQFSLLRRAVELTRPGGVVVYSTCTFAPEENEAIVTRALAELPVAMEPISIDAPHAPGIEEWEGVRFPDAVGHAWRVYPHHLDSGGLFMARLRRLPAEGRGEAGGEAGGEPGRHSEERNQGWSPIPPGFPGENAEAAADRVSGARTHLSEQYGLDEEAVGRLGWMVRGDTIWANTAGEWPVERWNELHPRGWRVVSLGIRGTRADSSGREVPSNQLFSRFGTHVVRERRLDLTRAELIRLLEGGEVERPEAPGGPLVLTLDGFPLGRSLMGMNGLKAEIPRSQGERLKSLLGG